jgi:transcriptional regulator with XRE-family HTH domain
VVIDRAELPIYMTIADRAKHLRELGMSDRAIARALGVSDKTIAKAAASQTSQRI